MVLSHAVSNKETNIDDDNNNAKMIMGTDYLKQGGGGHGRRSGEGFLWGYRVCECKVCGFHLTMILNGPIGFSGLVWNNSKC